LGWKALGYLAGGMSDADVLSQSPQLALEDIKACLAYAAERERRTFREGPKTGDRLRGCQAYHGCTP